MEERPYQQLVVRKAEWSLRYKRTLIVAPTGAGKTVIGGVICDRDPGSVVWATHTKDLVAQSATKLRELGMRVGIIAAGHDSDPFARVQVASIQTLLSRGLDLKADLVVLDEAHHFVAEQYKALVEARQAKRLLGLTATPERGDGKPLGDLFDELIVAANYSDLIRLGYLVPLRVLRPGAPLERGLAKKVLESYRKHGEGRSGFVFARRVEECHALAEEFLAAELAMQVVSDRTPKDERKLLLEGLALGRPRLLSNVYALTEGVDVPSASVAILARKFGHPSLLLQTAGRILRPCEGKTDALLIDLPGVTHMHGIPTEDREYSLTGAGIRRTEKGMSLKVCMYCGMTSESGGACPRCGQRPEQKKLKPMRIYNKELEAVYAGSATPAWAKRAELDRLRVTAQERGYQPGWISQNYERLFDEKPPLGLETPSDEKKAAFGRLLEQAKRLGYASGWAQHRYKAAYGAFPPRRWTMEQEQTT